ncbi:MAG: FAD-dependent oxidoreductase, partial [bacterium]
MRLASYSGFAALALRIGLAVMLGMAAFGLAPRVGTEMFEAPVLGAPDLELRLVHPFWIWIAWAEAAVAAAFVLGIYVRAAAAVTLVIGGLGLVLFGTGMVAYIGLVGGAAIYLLLQGAGSFYVPLPAFPGTRRITRWLADQPRDRAQVLLRVLAGLNLMYLGIDFKLLQPNLAVAMIVEHQVPTFGMETATFVLWMALVETLAGALILAGILIRPLAFFLILSFLFFSLLMGESVFSHIIFYALLVSFVTNAAGRWRRPIATDRPGKILILGGGFAGVHCALRLERLLGRFTNVEVTLVHRESYFQFHPLLLEVVGGTIQPGNIVNPIRRICTRTQFFHGEATSIDTDARQATVALISGEEITLGYDQLVVALEWEADFSGIPGLADHAHPIMTVGDALFLRQRVLQRLEEAEYLLRRDPQADTAPLLTFAMIGGALKGCAAAAEIRQLVDSALVSYPGIADAKVRVLLFEREERLLPGFHPSMGRAAQRRLRRMGVETFTGEASSAMTPEAVILASGEKIPCRTIVGTLSGRNKLIASLPGALPDGRLPVNEHLQVVGRDDILAVGDGAATEITEPFLPLRNIRMGRLAAFNALASIRGYRLHRWSDKHRLLYIAALGRKAAVARLLGIGFGGFPAWVLSRLLCVLTLPGLERNLRILIDWALDIPFRNDIVVLAPDRTPRVTHVHFEAGDVVFREGERGDSAYIIRSGEVEVVKGFGDGARRVATMSAGECFGEIALLSDVPRTATIRCISPVEVTVLPRDQFMDLAEGYKDLGNALKAGMA